MRVFGREKIPALVLIPLTALFALSFTASGTQVASRQNRTAPRDAAGEGAEIISLRAARGIEWEIYKAGGAARPAGTAFALGGLGLRLPDGRTVFYQSEPPEVSACHSADFPEQDFGGLRVARKVSVSRDGAFLRWMNIFTNDTDKTLAFEARLSNDPGPGGEFGAASGE